MSDKYQTLAGLINVVLANNSNDEKVRFDDIEENDIQFTAINEMLHFLHSDFTDVSWHDNVEDANTQVNSLLYGRAFDFDIRSPDEMRKHPDYIVATKVLRTLLQKEKVMITARNDGWSEFVERYRPIFLG